MPRVQFDDRNYQQIHDHKINKNRPNKKSNNTFIYLPSNKLYYCIR